MTLFRTERCEEKGVASSMVYTLWRCSDSSPFIQCFLPVLLSNTTKQFSQSTGSSCRSFDGCFELGCYFYSYYYEYLDSVLIRENLPSDLRRPVLKSCLCSVVFDKSVSTLSFCFLIYKKKSVNLCPA